MAWRILVLLTITLQVPNGSLFTRFRLLTLQMICEEMALDSKLEVANPEMLPEKPDEECDLSWIRVRESKLMPSFRSFGPIEHAARCVANTAAAGEIPTPFLMRHPSCSAALNVRRPPLPQMVVRRVAVREYGVL